MGLRIDRVEARRRFEEALAVALSPETVPDEWVERTQRVAEAASKTFVPVLGTALLAKATDSRVDAFSLREGSGHKSYSARSLAKEVLVPACTSHRIDIRTAGAEPLNNQPFLRAERVTTRLNVKANAQSHLEYLCECLTEVDFLSEGAALHALAAFLRARIGAVETQATIPFPEEELQLDQITDCLDRLLLGDSEGGKVGQAVIAAILSITYSDVRTEKINDPSAKWPGDVGVFHRGRLTLACEVKQRPFSESEILQFVKRISGFRVHRALIASLDRPVSARDQERLADQAYTEHRVVMAFANSAHQLLRECVMYADHDIPQLLNDLRRGVFERLQELHVSQARLAQWSHLLQEAIGAEPE